MNKRVLKKLTTPFDKFKPTKAILIVNLKDPQYATIQVFIDALKNKNIPYFIIGNKYDLITKVKVNEIKKHYPNIILTSMKTKKGLLMIKNNIKNFKTKNRIVILGVFNSGKSSLIKNLTGKNLKGEKLC